MTILKVLCLWKRLSTIQRLRDSYQATGIVKYRRRSGKPKMTTRRFKRPSDGNLRRVYQRNLYRRYEFWLTIISSRQIIGLRGYLYPDFLIKTF